MDDHDLIERVRRGDGAAFELLVRRHSGAAWRFARSLLHDDFAADEAVQDAFLKAHRALPSFRADAAFQTWLFTIVRRMCLDRLRSRKPPVVSLDEARHVRARRDSALLRLVIEQAMAELPVLEREAFALVDVLGHSRESAASIVGVPASTMRSRVARARERLAESLAEPDASGVQA